MARFEPGYFKVGFKRSAKHIPELSKQGESKPNPYGFEQFIHSLFQLIRLSHQSSGVRFQYQ